MALAEGVVEGDGVVGDAVGGVDNGISHKPLSVLRP